MTQDFSEQENKKLMQFQFLQANLEGVRSQLQQAVLRAEELANTKLTLENLDVSKSTQSFIQVGSDSFVKGSIENTKKVLVSVGAGAIIEKSREDAISIIEKRLSSLQDAASELAGQEQKISVELNRLQPEVQAIFSKK